MACPSKYLPKYNALIIHHVGVEGKSLKWFAKYVGVSRDTLSNWAKAHPEFAESRDLALEWAEVYWEERLEQDMMDRGVNAPLYKLYMRNRFPKFGVEDGALVKPGATKVTVTVDRD